MYKDDLDSYITTFNHLAIQVGFGREAAAIIDKFAKGLKYDLVDKILSHDNILETMNGWIDAAQKEQ
jgi:hypothetical protein